MYEANGERNYFDDARKLAFSGTDVAGNQIGCDRNDLKVVSVIFISEDQEAKGTWTKLVESSHLRLKDHILNK